MNGGIVVGWGRKTRVKGGALCLAEPVAKQFAAGLENQFASTYIGRFKNSRTRGQQVRFVTGGELVSSPVLQVTD
jgi:hypothetical protein